MTPQLPEGFGIPRRPDYYVEGPIGELEDWILEEMAERGDEEAEKELLRRRNP